MSENGIKTNEPTMVEMIDVLRENGDVYFGETEITCDQIADRLESQERELSDYAPFDGIRNADAIDAGIVKLLMENETELRKWIVRASWHCAKVHTQSVEIAELTARAESAERERDELVDLIPHTCNTCYFQSKNLLNEEPCVSCRTYVKWKWRGLQPQEGETK